MERNAEKRKGKTSSAKKERNTAMELDPALSSLFASSLGPVRQAPKQSRHVESQQERHKRPIEPDDDLYDASLKAPLAKKRKERGDNGEHDRIVRQASLQHESFIKPQGGVKLARRRPKVEPDSLDLLEARHMERMQGTGGDLVDNGLEAQSKASTTLDSSQHNRTIRSTSNSPDEDRSADDDDDDDDDDIDTDDDDLIAGCETLEASGSSLKDHAPNEDGDDTWTAPPLHESLSSTAAGADLDKARRTAFLGNVSTTAMTSKSARKSLLQHLSSFLPDMNVTDGKHRIESLRFRSIAFAGHLPKKAAFVTKDLMAATTPSTNAYVVYSSQDAMREAVRRLNGSVVLERHLRVDEVAHPSAVDHRRCVFVGNLGIVSEENVESLNKAHGDGTGSSVKKRTPRAPADVEEGLWRTFAEAGTVESVRVVRDAKTRVGKGFAYVQFVDANAVEAALLMHEKAFPPLLPRRLRVMRAKAVKRKTSSNNASTRPSGSQSNTQRSRPGQAQSAYGRAPKLYGRAGAALSRREGPHDGKPRPGTVFEGQRAKQDNGKSRKDAQHKKSLARKRIGRRTRPAAKQAEGSKP